MHVSPYVRVDVRVIYIYLFFVFNYMSVWKAEVMFDLPSTAAAPAGMSGSESSRVFIFLSLWERLWCSMELQ